MLNNIIVRDPAQVGFLNLLCKTRLSPEIANNIVTRLGLSGLQSRCNVASVCILFRDVIMKSVPCYLNEIWLDAMQRSEIKGLDIQLPIYKRMQEVGFTQNDLSCDRKTSIENLIKKIKFYSNCLDDFRKKSANARHKDYFTSFSFSHQEIKILPSEFIELSSVTHLDLNNNQIKTLPDSIGSLTSLTGLHVNNNQLKFLPNSFGGMISLEILDLSHNQLKALPESFGELRSLQFSELSNNQLQALPESFGKLSFLQLLELSNNQLQALPESFGWLLQCNNRKETLFNFNYLKTIDLSHNKLKTLPESFGKIQYLHNLDLSYNQLKILPESFKMLIGLQRLNLDNNDGFCQCINIKQFDFLEDSSRSNLIQLLEGIEQKKLKELAKQYHKDLFY